MDDLLSKNTVEQQKPADTYQGSSVVESADLAGNKKPADDYAPVPSEDTTENAFESAATGLNYNFSDAGVLFELSADTNNRQDEVLKFLKNENDIASKFGNDLINENKPVNGNKVEHGKQPISEDFANLILLEHPNVISEEKSAKTLEDVKGDVGDSSKLKHTSPDDTKSVGSNVGSEVLLTLDAITANTETVENALNGQKLLNTNEKTLEKPSNIGLDKNVNLPKIDALSKDLNKVDDKSPAGDVISAEISNVPPVIKEVKKDVDVKKENEVVKKNDPTLPKENDGEKLTPSSKEPVKCNLKDVSEIGPKELFSRCVLNTWFNPECLNPTVESIIYWRDPKVSGIVFGSTFIVLLSLAYFSLISVVANLGLTVLASTIGFRIYKEVLQTVQKTPQVHPLHEWLSLDISLPQDKVHEIVDIVLVHVNACIAELRRLFLVENLMDSIKFSVVLWSLTYVGAWFNGLTLVIIGFLALFTLPKIYENNKEQIDNNVGLAHLKLEEFTNKIKEALPAPLRRRLPEKSE